MRVIDDAGTIRTDQKDAPDIPPRNGTSETSALFNSKDLTEGRPARDDPVKNFE